MYLDGKLTWKNHVERTVEKTRKNWMFWRGLQEANGVVQDLYWMPHIKHI
jgi:hypothetical protein